MSVSRHVTHEYIVSLFWIEYLIFNIYTPMSPGWLKKLYRRAVAAASGWFLAAVFCCDKKVTQHTTQRKETSPWSMIVLMMTILGVTVITDQFRCYGYRDSSWGRPQTLLLWQIVPVSQCVESCTPCPSYGWWPLDDDGTTTSYSNNRPISLLRLPRSVTRQASKRYYYGK